MSKPRIEPPAHDRVEIEGTIIFRPTRLSPAQWLDFWDQAREGFDQASYDEGFDAGFKEGRAVRE